MELSRLAHPVLFWINTILIAYTLYGYLSPARFLLASRHDIPSRSDVEHGGDASTGIYGIYGQIALDGHRRISSPCCRGARFLAHKAR